MSVKSEWKLIEKIGSLASAKGLPSSLVKGIGDDCAVYRISADRYGLFTTDISIENTHFIINRISLHDIGYKAMMGNISDIAAMGGVPLLAFISIGIPDKLGEKEVDEIYSGLLEAADDANLIIAGGDTSRSENLVLSICLYGEKNGLPVYRESSRPGDLIYITGTTGDSKAGLDMILENDTDSMKKFPALVEKHKRPEARHRIVREIIDKFQPTSMIDISDGILSDIRRISEASKCGFIIDTEKLPVSDSLKKYSVKCGKNETYFALNSGEEYELLFTAGTTLQDMPSETVQGVKITHIGEITEEGYFLTNDGMKTEASTGGWDHFKKEE